MKYTCVYHTNWKIYIYDILYIWHWYTNTLNQVAKWNHPTISYLLNPLHLHKYSVTYSPSNTNNFYIQVYFKCPIFRYGRIFAYRKHLHFDS